MYVETATIGTSYRIGHGLLGDAGVAVRVGGAFGLGVTISSFMAKGDGEISASIPHPFFFQTPRTVTGTASGLRRNELVAHVQAIYTLHPSTKVDVALSGGPSLFRVQQDVVTDIAFTEIYPYDTATFASASTQRVSANKIGFNAGADVALRLSQHAGLGGGVAVLEGDGVADGTERRERGLDSTRAACSSLGGLAAVLLRSTFDVRGSRFDFYLPL